MMIKQHFENNVIKVNDWSNILQLSYSPMVANVFHFYAQHSIEDTYLLQLEM